MFSWMSDIDNIDRALEWKFCQNLKFNLFSTINGFQKFQCVSFIKYVGGPVLYNTGNYLVLKSLQITGF